MAVKPNDIITDGTVKWTVRKIGGNTDGNPVGTIIAFAGNRAIPEGYLLCDGAAISRIDYADLFAVIGTLYGAGNGSTTFTLPSTGGSRHLQGSVQPSSVGTYYSSGLPNITGYAGKIEYDNVRPPDGACYLIQDQPNYTWPDQAYTGGTGLGYTAINAQKQNAIYGASTIVQPPALNIRFLIKY